MSKLQQIFDAITPENLKDIPLLKTAMEIFIANLEENSQVATDISKVYDNIYKDTDSDILKASKDNLRKGLLDVYLSAFFNTISKAQKNEALRVKLEALGITNVPFINDVQRILNDEYFVTNKSFKEKLGTHTSVNYAYNLTKYLESAETTNDMKLYEVKPFHFKTEGSIFKEMYENLVKPLSHPLGFTYTYNQIIKESLQDLFGVEITYNLFTVEMRNLDGRIHVFSEHASAEYVKSLYVGTRIYPATGKLYTEEDFVNNVVVYTNKVPASFTDGVVDTRIVRTIIFADRTILQQKTNPLEITYANYDNYLLGVHSTIYDYNTSHWSLYVDYESDFTFQYVDNIDQFVDTIKVTDIKENNKGDNGQKYYNLTSGEYAFHVGGDAYSYAPGQDEVHYAYDDPAAITNEINSKFGVTISGSTTINNLVTLSLADSYGSTLTKNYIKPDANGDFATTISTYPLNGDAYTINVSVSEAGVTSSFSMKTTGLNNFDRKLGFTEVYDNYEQVSNTLMVKGYGPIGSTIELILTDTLGNTAINTGIVQNDGTWQIVLSLALKEAGNYRLDATIYKPNGKPLYRSFYEADNLRTRIADVKITVNPFDYPNGAPSYTSLSNYTVVPTIEDMAGFNTTSNIILKQIGELAIDDTYANPDQDLFTYMIDHGITNFVNLPRDIILNGAYIEGSNYSRVFQDILEEQETFVNYGRRVYPIDTSDFVVITSTDYATEDFIAYSLSNTGYYLYSNEEFGEDYYFYTNEPSGDGFYLTTLGDPT